jgi:hypothetical protein
MLFDDFLRNPAVKRALAAGEERVGKVVTQLLSSERVMHGVQTVVTSAVNAKSTFDRGVRTAMQAVSLPTTEDVRELRKRLDELESMLDRLSERVGEPGAHSIGKRIYGRIAEGNERNLVLALQVHSCHAILPGPEDTIGTLAQMRQLRGQPRRRRPQLYPKLRRCNENPSQSVRSPLFCPTAGPCLRAPDLGERIRS